MTTEIDTDLITKQRAFAVALVTDDRLFLEAMRDPHAVAADYGLTLTEEQASTIRCLQPEAIEKLRERLLDIGLWHTPDHYWGRK